MEKDRKKDHIELAFKSRLNEKLDLFGFHYEPVLSGHLNGTYQKFDFAGGEMSLPLWVSSMTGGTERAFRINHNLARACNEYGLGLGLGSCRPLLEDLRWEDFNLRPTLGPDAPFYSNFGIAQIEQLLDSRQISKIDEITKKLQANGVIIHINPLQEWAQPEGDRFKQAPIDVIKKFLDKTKFPIFIKEVGQGFGPQSLTSLARLPIKGIELAGFGGTNFTLLEQKRLDDSNGIDGEMIHALAHIGHTCEEMIEWINQSSELFKDKDIIISGGISNPVRGFLLNNHCRVKSVFGMASQLLKYADGEYEKLEQYIAALKDTLTVCKAYLKDGK